MYNIYLFKYNFSYSTGRKIIKEKNIKKWELAIKKAKKLLLEPGNENCKIQVYCTDRKQIIYEIKEKYS